MAHIPNVHNGRHLHDADVKGAVLFHIERIRIYGRAHTADLTHIANVNVAIHRGGGGLIKFDSVRRHRRDHIERCFKNTVDDHGIGNGLGFALRIGVRKADGFIKFFVFAQGISTRIMCGLICAHALKADVKVERTVAHQVHENSAAHLGLVFAHGNSFFVARNEGTGNDCFFFSAGYGEKARQCKRERKHA